MSVRTIKLLHVEDNVADRLLIARLLGSMKELVFNITRAATEITAVAELNKGGVEFVILDYKLPMGDGLGALKKLRQIDQAVPIIVLSGVTTTEIGAECMQAGADDYMNKQDLTAEKLAATVRKALNRANSWPALREQALPIARAFMERIGNDLLAAVDDYEKQLKQSGATSEQLQILFDSLTPDLESTKSKTTRPAPLIVRPLLLELIERLTAPPPPTPKPLGSSRQGV
ncbi:MAG: response regulator [Planctomycetia bacterium]|nr:response regulator [Planctomycetia bacterium]